MECFVCQGQMKHYFTKLFKMEFLNKCEYVRCEKCGMVISKTHYEMNKELWINLNCEFHSTYQGTNLAETENLIWVKRLTRESKIISNMYKIGWGGGGATLDYGCGDGKLVDIIKTLNPHTQIFKYDKYMNVNCKDGYLTESEIRDKKFDVVITGAVFEHLLGKNDIDDIVKLLSDKGTLAIHTLICEEVPCDPEWFYLLPVHCSFYSNRAMSILFENYGFKGCAYSLEARMWFFFLDLDVMESLRRRKESLEGDWFFSNKFIEYWKQKPYHDDKEKNNNYWERYMRNEA